MSEQELRELILATVREVLAATGKAPTTAPRTGLVLFTGALLGFEDAIGALKRIERSGQVGLDWIATPSATKILDRAAIDSVGMCPAAQSLVQRHDFLIVPTTTVNMVAKVAHGVGDCLASNVVAEFIMSNKPVFVATNAAAPDSHDKLSWFPNLPAGYAAMLKGNLETLRSFGVRLSSADQLDQAVLSACSSNRVDPSGSLSLSKRVELVETNTLAEPVIHERLVATCQPGTTLRIGPRALVTALAREAAAERHITFEREA